jgi:hypothetical protein
MYVTIDRDNMRFFAKHPDHTALSLLADIELAFVSVLIVPCDEPSDFMQLTDLELRLLFKHTTGADHSNAYRPSLLAACVALAQQLPERRGLNCFHLELQSNAIQGDKVGRYLYVPGASKPQRKADLFEPEPLTCQQGWSAEQLAEFAKQAPQAERPAAVASTAPEPRSSPQRPAVAAGAVAAQPRGGGKAVIWQHMDQLWEKAGKPMDAKLVLGLRKACMDELEALNLAKRSSASSELGNWMKARCPQ